MNKVGADGAINITTIVTRPYSLPTTNMNNYQLWGYILNCDNQNAKDYFNPNSSLAKDGKHLVISLANKEKKQSCNEALRNTDPKDMSQLRYRSIIMLEDEEFEYRTSARIPFNIKPNFPIVSIRYKEYLDLQMTDDRDKTMNLNLDITIRNTLILCVWLAYSPLRPFRAAGIGQKAGVGQVPEIKGFVR